MLLLARSPRRLASRLSYAAIAYWSANVVLAAVELRWHPLYHLLLWDISQFRTMAPLMAHLANTVH